MGSQAATTSSLSRASFCRQSSAIRAVCAKERSYGSVRGASGQLASLPRPSQPDRGEVIAKRKGVAARRGLKEAWSVGSAAHADRRERRFREPRFVRGCRTKVLSQRKTLAVDHHHPLRALAPLGFSNSSAPFLAGAKLPSRKDSLHCSCFRW